MFTLLRETSARDHASVRVTGDCMEPLISRGQMVSFRSRRLYLPGDVIVFRTAAGHLSVHRVLGARWFRGRLALVTRGDHCVIHDAPVPLDAVAGAATCRVTVRDRVQAIAEFAQIVFGAITR